MVTEIERQAIVDEEHLRLLPVFYWVLGGVDIFVSLYGLIYIGMGIMFATVPMEPSGLQGEPPPSFFGWFMFAIGAGFMLAFGLSAALRIATGFWIKNRRHRTLCLVSAGISCLSMPFGTVVGVFTFLALLRPSVAALFTPRSDAGPHERTLIAEAAPTDQAPDQPPVA